MTEAKPLDVMWFTSTKGTVGVVKVDTPYDGIEYRISAVDGFMEKMDVLQVMAWGARFPDAAGEALFGGGKK
jgi:hypothetical protein